MRKREDVLVSVCCPELTPGPENIAVLKDIAAQIDARYRYWEMLVIAEASKAEAHELLLSAVPNLRLLKVHNGSPFYRKRVVAASEAIGDIVLLVATEEAGCMDLPAMLEIARAEGCIVMGWRDQSSALNPVVRVLGNASGFQVSTRDMLTAAYPRTLLNLLLAYPDRQIALRFAPRDGGVPLRRMEANRTVRPMPRGARGLGRRLGLMQKLVANAAPRVLGLVALLSAGVFFVSLIFALYAVGVWLLLDTVQPGWLTTSLALSMTAAFLGAAIFGLSSGLQRLIDIATPELLNSVISERSAVDLFSQVTTELNIELEVEEAENKAAAPPRADPEPLLLAQS